MNNITEVNSNEQYNRSALMNNITELICSWYYDRAGSSFLEEEGIYRNR